MPLFDGPLMQMPEPKETSVFDFLTPARRKAIYAALAAAGAILTVLGLVSESVVTGYVGLIDAGLAFLGLILAAWKAHRWDFRVLYVGFAAVVVALKTLGIFDDGVSSHILDVAAAVAAAMPLVLAAVRTDTSTPTGEPEAEYVARHAEPPAV